MRILLEQERWQDLYTKRWKRTRYIFISKERWQNIYLQKEIYGYYTVEYRTRYFIEKDRGQDLYFIEKERRKINKYRKGQDIPYVKEKGRGQNILYSER